MKKKVLSRNPPSEYIPKCFGASKSCGNCEECGTCPYYGSCQYYVSNPLDEDTRYSTKREKWRRHNSVSLEAMGETLENSLEASQDDDTEDIDTPKYTKREFLSLLRTLLTEMDNTGLALAIYALTHNITTNAELARSLECSRQNSHKALLNSARKDPHLQALLTAVFFRFGKLAHEFDK